MATAASGGMNPAYLLDPSLYGGQQQIDQQQAIANLLLQQGLAPMGGTEMAGQVAIRRSPVEGIAKIAALLSGQNLQQTANQGQQALAQRQAGVMAQMFGMGQPQGTLGQQDPQGGMAATGPSPTGYSVSQQQPQGGGSGPMSVAGASPMTNYMDYATDPAAHMKAVMDQFAMTPEMKMAAAAYGVNSPAYKQALQAQAAKAGYVAPIDAKPGTPVLDPFTYQPKFFAPKTDDGVNLDFKDPLHPTAAAIPGYSAATAGIKGAQTSATSRANAENEMTSVTLPNGQTQQMTRAQALDYANGSSNNKGIKFNIAPGTEGQVRQQIVDGGDMGALAQFDKQVSGGAKMPGFTSGQSTADAEAAKKSGALPQESMETRFNALREQDSQAQTTNSYLQEIKRLAPQAITGQFSDRLQFVNSLLSTAGSERATDAASATNLLDKYSNKIVANLGSGGMGTDAARAILAAANPNSHMTVDAINEAVDNLIGANAMTQAKSKLLSQPYNQRDTAGYQQKEQAFSDNADPRIWQYANIKDQAARRTFLQNAIKTDPNFMEKAQNLHNLGAI